MFIYMYPKVSTGGFLVDIIFVDGTTLITAVFQAAILLVIGVIVSFGLSKYIGKLAASIGVQDSNTFERVALYLLALLTVGTAIAKIPNLTTPNFIPISEIGLLLNNLAISSMVLAVPLAILAAVSKVKK